MKSMYFKAMYTLTPLLGSLAGQDDSIVLSLEPLHGVLLGQTVGESNLADLLPPVSDVAAGSSEDHEEVHSIDTNAGIVLDAEVNVLVDTEAEVSVVGEVILPQLVLLHLEATLQDLLCLRPPDCAMNCDLLPM